MNWDRITEKLFLKNGILFAGENPEISYPSEGNDACFIIEDRSFWFNHRANFIVQVVKNFPSDGMIFDVGGGNGHVSAVLEKSGFRTTLVEPGIRGVLNAKQRGLKRLICATIDSACFPKDSLPAIGVFDVLEHIHEDKKFLVSIREALKPGGMLYLTVPAYQFLWSAEDEYAGHYRRYTLNGLKKQLEDLGFEIAYATYIFYFLPVFVFLFRSVPYIFGFKKENSVREFANDHIVCNKFLRKIIDKVFQSEIGFVRNKKRIWFGSTCLVAARAIK